MNLRPAEYADLAACEALPLTVQSQYVWQLQVQRDPTQALSQSEWSIALRCVRLPRPVPVTPPGPAAAALWSTASAVFIAADDADEIVGFVVLSASPTRPAALALPLLAVAPAARQRGVATALLRQALVWARAGGFEAVTAATSTRNHPAASCLARSGFTFAGYSESQWPRGELALLWQRAV